MLQSRAGEVLEQARDHGATEHLLKRVKERRARNPFLTLNRGRSEFACPQGLPVAYGNGKWRSRCPSPCVAFQQVTEPMLRSTQNILISIRPLTPLPLPGFPLYGGSW